VTGDIHFVDSGYNIITMPNPEVLARAGELNGGSAERVPTGVVSD
jgi:enoyl-[acyl-carrier protein] reductase I